MLRARLFTMIDVRKGAQLEQLKMLLRQSGLPYEDLEKAVWFRLLGVSQNSALLAAAGLERCEDALLLRSVITHPDHRNQGFGGQIVEALHKAAKESGYEEVWLLTEETGNYFANHHGYEIIDRSLAPLGIQNSAQFSALCPGDACLMRKRLT